MKRKLIPYSLADRFLVAFGIPIAIVVIFLSIRDGAYWMTAISVFSIGYNLTIVYIFQDPPEQAEDEYSHVISTIVSLSTQLEKLGAFLERERARVAATQETIRKLGEEKAKLEPIVLTQRETVDAILAAHAAQTARTAWKERLVGFGLGMIASFIASFAYGYFRK